MVHILKFAAITFLLSIGLSAYFIYGNYKLTYATDQFDRVEFYALQYDLSPKQEPLSRDLKLKRSGIHAPQRDDQALKTAYKEGGIIRKYGANNPEIMVLGDSHAQMWANTIDRICEELDLSVAYNTMIATDPFVEIPLNPKPSSSKRYTSKQKYQFNRSVLDRLMEWKPSLVIIGHRWDGTTHSDSTKKDLLEFIDAFGGKVLLLEQPPVLSIGNTNTSMYLSYMGSKTDPLGRIYLDTNDSAKIREGRATVKRLARKYRHVEYLKVFDALASEENTAWVLNGTTIFYYDDDHLSDQGAEMFQEDLRTAILNQLESGF